MLDFLKHDFVSLVLGIAVVIVVMVWTILIGPEMLIDIPEGTVIQFNSLMRRLIIVFEYL